MTAALITVAAALAGSIVAIVLLVRAWTSVAPKLVEAAERETAALSGKRAAELERNDALRDVAASKAMEASALARLGTAQELIASLGEERAAHVVTSIRDAPTAAAALDIVVGLLQAGPRLPVPSAGGAAASADRPASPAVPAAPVAAASGDGRDPAG